MTRSMELDTRWEPFLNCTADYDETGVGETVPAFGCVQIANWPGNPEEERTNLPRSGQSVWLCRKPFGTPVIWQQPWAFAFNGPTPVPPGGRGKCTRSWPCRGITTDLALANGLPCGPRTNSWFLHYDGFAFLQAGWDSAFADAYPVEQVPGYTQDNYRVIRVVPNTQPAMSAAAYVCGGATSVPAGEPILYLDTTEATLATEGWSVYPHQGGLWCPGGGLYLFGFSATIQSADAPRESSLVLYQAFEDLLEADTTTAAENLIWRGSRLQDVEQYQDESYITHTYQTGENVSVTGYFEVAWGAPRLARIRNAAEYALTVSDFYHWAVKIANARPGTPYTALGVPMPSAA